MMKINTSIVVTAVVVLALQPGLAAETIIVNKQSAQPVSKGNPVRYHVDFSGLPGLQDLNRYIVGDWLGTASGKQRRHVFTAGGTPYDMLVECKTGEAGGYEGADSAHAIYLHQGWIPAIDDSSLEVDVVRPRPMQAYRLIFQADRKGFKRKSAQDFCMDLIRQVSQVAGSPAAKGCTIAIDFEITEEQTAQSVKAAGKDETYEVVPSVGYAARGSVTGIHNSCE